MDHEHGLHARVWVVAILDERLIPGQSTLEKVDQRIGKIVSFRSYSRPQFGLNPNQ
jgi:hypothetical protein